MEVYSFALADHVLQATPVVKQAVGLYFLLLESALHFRDSFVILFLYGFEIFYLYFELLGQNFDLLRLSLPLQGLSLIIVSLLLQRIQIIAGLLRLIISASHQLPLQQIKMNLLLLMLPLPLDRRVAFQAAKPLGADRLETLPNIGRRVISVQF